MLVLCPYPLGFAPSQRFRVEQYLPYLHDADVAVTVAPFFTASTMRILYKPGHFGRKFFGVLAGFFRRLALLPSLVRYQYVLVHREATPLGPPIFEYLLFWLGKKVIYDFDDAIFIAKTSEPNRLIRRLRCGWKVAYICTHAYRVSVSNLYLAEWAKAQTANVVLIPTSVALTEDFPTRRPPLQGRRIVIGWTGSHTTVTYLKMVEDVLAALSKTHDFEFVVICEVDPGFNSIRHYRFIPWCAASAVADLAQIDIGLTPVPNGAWELAKPGFKSVQYSAVGAVPIVSNTGSPHDVVIDGRTGYVVENSPEAWAHAIQNLLENPDLIFTMGAAARSHIESRFSVAANAPAFLSLFDLPALSNGAKN